MNEILDSLSEIIISVDDKIRTIDGEKTSIEDLLSVLHNDVKNTDFVKIKGYLEKYNIPFDENKYKYFDNFSSFYDYMIGFSDDDATKRIVFENIKLIDENLSNVVTRFNNEKTDLVNKKRYIQQLYGCLERMESNETEIIEDNLQEIYKLFDKLDGDDVDKIKIALILCKLEIEQRDRIIEIVPVQEEMINIDEPTVQEEPMDISEQLENNAGEVLEPLRENYEVVLSAKQQELNSYLDKVKELIESSREFMYEFNAILNKYHMTLDSFVQYALAKDFTSVQGLSKKAITLEMFNYASSIYDLEVCLMCSINDDNIEDEILEIKEIISKFNEHEIAYVESLKVQPGSFDEFASESENVMLFVKNADGKFYVDEFLDDGTKAEKDNKKLRFNSALSIFFNKVYFTSAENSNSLVHMYGGNHGHIEDVIELNKRKIIRDKKYLDPDFEFKRFRSSDCRTGFIALPICEENRKKLSKRYGNDKLLRSGKVIVFIGTIVVHADHDDYNKFISIVDKNRSELLKLKALLADPKTREDELFALFEEGMEYARKYIKKYSNERGVSNGL